MNITGGKTLAYGIGIPLGVFAILAVLTAFLGRDIGRRAEGIQDIRAELAARASSVEALAYLRGDAERAQRYSSVLDNILPTKDQLIAFPREFSAIAAKYNVRLATSFGAEEAASADAPGSIAFVFTADGALQNILAFLRGAEESRYIIQWTAFEFLRGASGYGATIAGKVFSQ